MPEIKNNFVQGKMNKDLDDRLLPNGQYRDALNVTVGRSDDSDVGVVQNVKGNTLSYCCYISKGKSYRFTCRQRKRKGFLFCNRQVNRCFI